MVNSMKVSMALPDDPVLAGLPQLLDIEVVREHLNARGANVSQGEVYYVRYKAQTNCLAGYRFTRSNASTGNDEQVYFYGKCLNPSEFEVAREKSRMHRWTEVQHGQAVMPVEEFNTIFYAFPNDAQLDGLRLLREPDKLTEFIQTYLPEYESDDWRLSNAGLKNTLVRYKPERRAVFRFRTKAVNRNTDQRQRLKLYWRVYGDGQAGEVFRRMDMLADTFGKSDLLRTPRPIGWDPYNEVLMMEEIEGTSLEMILSTSEAAPSVRLAGAGLARLHSVIDKQLPLLGVEDYLEKARESQRMLSSLSARLEAQADRLFESLAQSAPKETIRHGFAHGDFYYGQVLINDSQVGFVDFDRSHIGSPLVDVGNFLAHLKLLKLGKRLVNTDKLSSEFLNAYNQGSGLVYDSRELQWWTVLSLLLLTVGPFRRLEPEWIDRSSRILEAAEELLC